MSDEINDLLNWLHDPAEEYDRQIVLDTMRADAERRAWDKWLSAVSNPDSAESKELTKDAQLRRLLQSIDGHDTESSKNGTKPPMPTPRLNDF